MHQGDLDRVKGVYPINAVNEVIEYQFTGCVERISENFLLPVLERLLESFHVVVQGLHSDNGSENVNCQVDALLEKLHVAEFTKSRLRRSNLNIQIGSLAGPSCCEARCSAKGPAAPRAWTRQPAQALPQPLQLGHAQPQPACHVERQGGCPPRVSRPRQANHQEITNLAYQPSQSRCLARAGRAIRRLPIPRCRWRQA